MLKRPAILCAVLLFAAVLVFGIARLFELRLDRGDIYPPYSSLRGDPLGASVFYESLERVPGVSAQRYFEETFKIDNGKGRALFLLGTEPYAVRMMSRSEFDVVQRFIQNGGRLVIAYFPEVHESYSSRRARLQLTNHPSANPSKPKLERPSAKPNSPSGTNSLSSTNQFKIFNATNTAVSAKNSNTNSLSGTNDYVAEDDAEFKSDMKGYVDLTKEWGFDVTYNNLSTNFNGEIDFPRAWRVSDNSALPAALAIHTAVSFTDLTNGWATIYQCDKKTPVVVERKFGAGSVVVLADSYPFSNEAMFKNRSAALLAWLLGGSRDVIFDEAHLGVVEQPGVATLMRRYQLHGLICGLLLVAGLFIWKNASSLVPPVPEGDAEHGPVIAGRDSSSGFVNLLRRGIAPAELINVCFAEWKKSGARLAAISPAQRREVEQLVQQQAAQDPRHRRPVENYRDIMQIFKRRK
jgi:hypothetical protein